MTKKDFETFEVFFCHTYPLVIKLYICIYPKAANKHVETYRETP
jgi:hypothetical protein